MVSDASSSKIGAEFFALLLSGPQLTENQKMIFIGFASTEHAHHI